MFADRSSIVAVVESQPDAAKRLIDCLGHLKFSSIRVFRSISELLATLPHESVNWILTPTGRDQVPNALHLLNYLSRWPQLGKPLVTLLIDADEHSCLPVAFERGLFSFLPRSGSFDEMSKAISQQLYTFESTNWKSCLASAEFFRQFLLKERFVEALLQLEQGLISLFPERPEQYLKLAEAFFLRGDIDQGKATLWQASALGDHLRDVVAGLEDKYLQGKKDYQAIGYAEVNPLGLRGVLVIDSDGAGQIGIKTLLEGIGVLEIHCVGSGIEAWEWLTTHRPPSLVLTEWRIPGMAAPVLIQRMQQTGLQNVPVIVVSGLVGPQDAPLLSEMSVAAVISKPFKKRSFLASLVKTVQEDHDPTAAKPLAIKFRAAVRSNKPLEAKKFLGQYIAIKGIGEDRKFLLKAEYAYFVGRYAVASKFVVEVLKHSKDSIHALNLLGKCLMRLGDFEAAQVWLEKAQKLSPLNIERLCSLAEVKTELGNIDDADSVLSQAKQIDPENAMVREADAKLTVEKGPADRAAELLSKLESLDTVISYMNNRAVSLSRTGSLADGIELYQKTFEAIPEKQLQLKAVVAYNMALGYLRMNNHEEASRYLNQAIEVGSGKVHVKATSLTRRLAQAVASGKVLVLEKHGDAIPRGGPGGEEDASELEAELSELHATTLASLQRLRGEACLFRVFRNKVPVDPATFDLINDEPEFAPGDDLGHTSAESRKAS